MGFENKYPNRKDWLKPYHKSGKFDRTCRPGGTCPYCQGNRTVGDKKRCDAARDSMNDIREAVHTVFHKGVQFAENTTTESGPFVITKYKQDDGEYAWTGATWSSDIKQGKTFPTRALADDYADKKWKSVGTIEITNLGS